MFFDFHLHVSFKANLSRTHRISGKKPNCWGYTNSTVLSNVLDSQSTLTHLKNGKIYLAVVALHPPEQAFCKARFVRRFLPFFSPLDGRKLAQIASGNLGYFTFMEQEYSHLMESENYNGNSFRLISTANEIIYDNRLNLLISVEGAHSFIDDMHSITEQRCKNAIDNLISFKNRQFRLFFITLSHLAQEIFCTHAHGIKFALLFSDKRFYPSGFGISEYGKSFIRAAASSKNGPRVLIDIKHMSFVSRLQFYDLREKEFPTLPIIVSHTGVTGGSIEMFGGSMTLPTTESAASNGSSIMKVKYNKKIGYFNTCFNPISINLYDNEIKIIIESKGLIGLSMDQRILGFGKSHQEFFSMNEYNIVFNTLKSKKSRLSNYKIDYSNTIEITTKEVYEEFQEDIDIKNSRNSNIHFWYF